MSAIRDLAAFVCGASVASLPEAERAIQRRHVADTLLAATVGAGTSEGRGLRGVLPKNCVADLVGLQAAVIRHTEIDDIHTPSCTTPSSVTVPVALGLAHANEQYDPERVASAIWVGTELLVRLGLAIDGARILYRGIWPTYFAAPLGAAAVAARMNGLSEEKTAHALSLALMLTAGRSGRFAGRLPGRSVLLGMAVSAGMRAVEAAELGVGGDPDLLSGNWLREAHGIDAEHSRLTSGLGQGSIYPQLSLKPFCSAKQAIAATQALSTLIDEGLRPEAIANVTVRVPPAYARMISTKPEAGSRSSMIVSAAYQLGLAATRPDRLYDIERADVIAEALVFAGKVSVVPDENLLAGFPACFPAEIEVSAGDQTLRRRVTAALGDPSHPLDDDALKQKAERVFEQAGSAQSGSKLIALGLNGLNDRASCKAMVAVARVEA
ncbi:MAG TPA: MmgE/PrpD family protein [Xanthobacteraceae bacterium]|nr:MmgE/PrpD family protein [Xanthobacteraceae bacterium]